MRSSRLAGSSALGGARLAHGAAAADAPAADGATLDALIVTAQQLDTSVTYRASIGSLDRQAPDDRGGA